MPEPSSFGYGFSEHNYGGTVLLDWTVTAQLSTVDRRGELLEQVDSDRLSIGRLDAAHQPNIEVEPPPDRRGFFRYDMQIANAAGRVLGSYGAYFKVVAPSWRPKLQLSRDTVYPGEQLRIRLASFGSETVAYAEPFGVMRFEDGRWALAPDLTPDRWLKWLGFISPGLTGRCNRLVLPSGTPPGRYRVVKVVGTQLWPEGRRTRVVADFHVIEPGADIEYRPTYARPVPSGPDPVVSRWTSWPYLTSCGTAPFDPISVFSGPTNAERGGGRPERSLRRRIAESQTWFPPFPRHHWRQLTRSPRYVAYAHGRLPSVEVLTLHKSRKGRWKLSTYSGGCEPTSVLGGPEEVVDWDLAADQELGPATTEVSIDLGSGPCASGMSQNERAIAPVFFELEGKLMMVMRLRPLPPGGYTCEGIIDPPLTVTLPAPLGDRQVYDGSVYPPTKQWPSARR